MKHAIVVACSVLVLMFSLPCHGQNQQQPATLRSLLLHELHTTHDQADCFVPINVAVDGLTAEQARWQPPAGGHSAGQLTYHLLYWNRRNLVKFKGGALEKFGGDNDETFVKFWRNLSNPPTSKSWHCGRQRLRISVPIMLIMSGRSSTCASCRGRGTRTKV
jgi:hypothetical protein